MVYYPSPWSEWLSSKTYLTTGIVTTAIAIAFTVTNEQRNRIYIHDNNDIHHFKKYRNNSIMGSTITGELIFVHLLYISRLFKESYNNFPR